MYIKMKSCELGDCDVSMQVTVDGADSAEMCLHFKCHLPLLLLSHFQPFQMSKHFSAFNIWLKNYPLKTITQFVQ